MAGWILMPHGAIAFSRYVPPAMARPSCGLAVVMDLKKLHSDVVITYGN
jgi:hypothetical protein